MLGRCGTGPRGRHRNRSLPWLRIQTAYTWADYTFGTYRIPNGAATDTLDGKRLAGVPRHFFRGTATLTRGALMVELDQVTAGEMFGDDRNTLAIDGWGTGVTSVRSSVALSRGGMHFEPFVAINTSSIDGTIGVGQHQRCCRQGARAGAGQKWVRRTGSELGKAMTVEIREMTPPDWTPCARFMRRALRPPRRYLRDPAPSWITDATHLAVAYSSRSMRGGPRWAAFGCIGPCVYAGLRMSCLRGRRGARAGVVRRLLQALVEASERAGLWTIQAGIFPDTRPAWRSTPPRASALSGAASGSGKLDGRWRDTLLLERRSTSVGT